VVATIGGARSFVFHAIYAWQKNETSEINNEKYVN
jgi:hypothetical protein